MAGEEDAESKPRSKRTPNELLMRDNQLYEALTLLKGLHILGMNAYGSQHASKNPQPARTGKAL